MRFTASFRIFRYKQNDPAPHYDTFTLEVRPDEYVLDAIERIWATQDSSLVFRHACHHATCGSCGMVVNGREALTCIVKIESVAKEGSTVTVEPLRNLPVVRDLLVDMEPFYAKMEKIQFVPVGMAEPIIDETSETPVETKEPAVRLEDCIECALCVSACPITATNPNFLGPATLGGVWRMIEEPRRDVDVQYLQEISDSDDGLWRCHGAFECSEICPTNIDLAGKIMDLRRRIIGHKLKRLVGLRS